ncbi:hypothetical protein BZA70DRAFT_282194 [Myxozyma melibiosi]|uniref:Zn(2)-C6 fungal-type domain-containing protein n=1 Tax=Myxozyma melibiosi TaxID=54550 RepID=A0ABR1F1V1_9ASCO
MQKVEFIICEAETESQDSLANGGNRRQKVRTSCESCRVKKTKCDGLRPTCGYCSQRQLECKYGEVPMMAIRTRSISAFRTSNSPAKSKQSSAAGKVNKRKASEISVDESPAAATTIAKAEAVNATTATTAPPPPPLAQTARPRHSTHTEPVFSPSSPSLSVSVQSSGVSDTEITSASGGSPKHDHRTILDYAVNQRQNLVASDPVITTALGRGTPSLSTLPARHTLLPGSLLQWPKVSMLTVERYDFSHSVLSYETKVQSDALPDDPVGALKTLDLIVQDEELASAILDSFMLDFFAFYPILDLDQTRKLISKWQAVKRCTCTLVEKSLLAIIFALACQSKNLVAKHPQLRGTSKELYELCNFLLPSALRFATIGAVQFLILMSAYESMLFRPMGCYRFYSLAWSNLQILLGRDEQYQIGLEWDLSLRAYWTLFILDSQFRAEFELAPLGIGTLESEIELPSGISEDGSSLEKYGGINIWYYLYARISSRRLLNRVHSTLYSQDPAVALMKPGLLITTTEELYYQLETWRENLPEQLQFSLDDEAEDLFTLARVIRQQGSDNLQDAILAEYRGFLKIQYDITRTILHRFYLYYVLHISELSPQQDALVEKWFYDKARLCVVGEINYNIPLMFLETGNILALPSHFAHSVALMMAYMAADALGLDRADVERAVALSTSRIREYVAPHMGIAYAILERLDSMWDKLRCSCI